MLAKTRRCAAPGQPPELLDLLDVVREKAAATAAAAYNDDAFYKVWPRAALPSACSRSRVIVLYEHSILEYSTGRVGDSPAF